MTSLGTEREQRIRWRHRLPRGAPVDRHRILLEAARGKRVIHVGFVDELAASKLAQGVWLHARLAEAAASLIGLDSDDQGVEWARGAGFDAHVVDAQSPEAVAALAIEPADVVVAGELIEHLDAPGPFLEAMRALTRPEGMLVLTTPNAFRALNFLAPLTGAELVHPDHTAWHSPQTIRALLERNGWRVEGVAYYRNPRRRVSRCDGFRPFLTGHAANLLRTAFGAAGQLAPYWSEGIVAWARPSAGNP